VPVGRKAIKESDWGRHTDTLWLSFLVLIIMYAGHAAFTTQTKIKYLLQNTVGKFKLEDKGKTLDDNSSKQKTPN